MILMVALTKTIFMTQLNILNFSKFSKFSKQVCAGKKHVLFIGISCGMSVRSLFSQITFHLAVKDNSHDKRNSNNQSPH